MKILKLTISFLLTSTLTFAQDGWEKKQKKSEGKAPEQAFGVIDAHGTAPTRIPFNIKKKILRDNETGAIMFAENLNFGNNIKNAKKSITSMAFDFLESIKADLKIKNTKTEFKILQDTEDELGLKHLKMQQSYNNIPVYNAELILHTNAKGVFQNLNGRVFPSFEANDKAKVSVNQAINLSLKDVAKTSIVQKAGNMSKFLDLDPDKASLLFYPINDQMQLAYEIQIRPNMLERWVYFINANTGAIIDKYNHTCTLDGTVTATARDLNAINRTFNVSQLSSDFFMIDTSKPMYNAARSVLPDKPVGAIWTINAQNAKIGEEQNNMVQISSSNRNSWSDKAVSAHTNASICFDYYKSKFNRNSLNGAGGNIISVINIADEDGVGMDNAYWNGQFMGYGNGKDAFKPLAGALDVAGHEMTHGVIENTAKLEYRNQSGALNESFADVFGAMIDRDDWTLGEDVVKAAAFPSGALRSLENPNQGGTRDNGYQPKNMSQYAYLKDTPAEDNGGVHINSGIPNHAFYKFATATNMNRDKAEKVYYRVLTNYLTRTSKFTDLRLAVIQATTDLFPGGTEIAAAKAAFDAVGIMDPGTETTGGGNTGTGSSNTNSTLPVNPGTESLLVFDPRASDQSLYTGAYNGNTDFAKITNGVGCLAKPSITDDGSFAYFVGKDKKIYRIDLVKKTAPQAVSTDAAWRNVAISKNGKVLAALTSSLDNFIYIFDLVGNKSKKIKLYNPTYTTGIKTGEVLYADSFEWDYTGEKVIYDAFNQAKSAFTNIEYWDVGILRAWDPVKNDFGDGTVDKMFTNLAEGDNIGNPALSKTNTNILAFDYFSSTDKQFNVIIIDFSKPNGVSAIEKNNDVGYPDFSKSDKILSFNALDGTTSVVKAVGLKADKISPDGKSNILFTDAKWAVWYAIGQRTLPTKELQVISIASVPDKAANAKFDILASTNSNLALQYVVVSGDATISGKTVTLGSKPGKVVIKVAQAGDNKFQPNDAQVTFCILPGPALLSQGLNTVIASGGSLYQFFVNGTPVGGQTANPVFKTDLFGQYTVRVVTADGCQGALSNAVGIAALANEPLQDLASIYPNPGLEQVEVKLDNGLNLKTIVLYNAKGEKVLQSNKAKFNISKLPAGSYNAVIATQSGTIHKRIVKL